MTLTTGLFVAWMTASGADMTTTAMALKHGAVEQNGWFNTPAVLITEKAAIGTLQVVAMKKWEHQHRMLVRLMAAGSAGFYTGLAVHNYRVYVTSRESR
jgi:hypothetical protein